MIIEMENSSGKELMLVAYTYPGDFSKDNTYRVMAADGSEQDYILKTAKGF